MIRAMTETYQISYHQIRVLALASLIVSHVLSFSNQMHQVPLESLPIFTFIAFFSTFGSLFVPIAGVAFRLAIDPAVQHHRLRGPLQTTILRPLLFLILIEALKDYLIYWDVEHLFHWNFLKTLLLAWILIEVVARIHIGALLSLSLFLTLNYQTLVNWTKKQQASVVQVTDQLMHWNTVHTTLLICLILPSAWLLFWTARSSTTRILKLWIVLFILMIFGAGFLRITALHPTLENYVFFRNWFLLGLNGQAVTSNLYSALAWVPSVLNAFIITHLVLSIRPHFEPKIDRVAPITLLFAVISYLIYRHFNAHPQHLINVWDIPTFNQSSVVIEFFKLCSLINLFACAIWLNSHFNLRSQAKIWAAVSQSSFVIYILCTTLALWVSLWLGARLSLLWSTVSGTMLIALTSFLAALAASWISSKKLRLKLMRA